MRLPNGYGSVYKLSGNRRKPWAARKTVGWKLSENGKTALPVYKFIGYFSSRKEALQALTEYNIDPHDLHFNKITFQEVYERWSDSYFENIGASGVSGYKAVYKLCDSLNNMRFADIKIDDLQYIVDTSKKNTPTLKRLKTLFNLLYDYAVIHEIVPADKREMVRYLNISKPGNPNAYDRKPFAKKDIKKLWDAVDSNEYITVILILIYTGLRVGELLELKKEDIHLDDRWFFVKKAKTDAGIREVPIAEKIVPFFEYWMSRNCSNLICTPDDNPFLYRNYYDSYWTPMMKELALDKYTPHCTRHTCISLLTEANVDERILQQIVGHKGQNVTRIVYTHVDLPAKLEAINRI